MRVPRLLSRPSSGDRWYFPCRRVMTLNPCSADHVGITQMAELTSGLPARISWYVNPARIMVLCARAKWDKMRFHVKWMHGQLR